VWRRERTDGVGGTIRRPIESKPPALAASISSSGLASIAVKWASDKRFRTRAGSAMPDNRSVMAAQSAVGNRKRVTGAARELVAQLPSAPGGYRFRDAGERVLYIGRAANLRRRVASYWTSLTRDERAAQLQLEIEAFEWVVSEQRATVSEPHGFDVYGWADGVLVHFEVRDGCLSVWKQRSCADATAGPRVSATPATWREFARLNAELAVRLAQLAHK
jgi:hypothetical protein